MQYKYIPRKAIVFKIIYLCCTIAVGIFLAYELVANLVQGFRAGIKFDDILVLITVLFSLLFEGSIAGFIIRSFKEPTLLMKNLVFKWDGTPYVVGIVSVCVSAVVALALTVVMFLSAYFFRWLGLPFNVEQMIFGILLIIFVNLAFTSAYFFTFRHESGSIAII